MVSRLTNRPRMSMPAAHNVPLKARVWVRLSSPLAVGRQAVRFIRASMPCSIRQLKAAAEPATSQMPMQAATALSASAAVGMPGTASSMPMTAQKTMSCTTRGLVSTWYWGNFEGGGVGGRATGAGGVATVSVMGNSEKQRDYDAEARGAVA